MDIQTQLSHRRIVLDSRFGNALSGSDNAGSHFEVQLHNALNIPRGGQMRVDSVSFPHSNVPNVSVRNNKLYWIEKRESVSTDGTTLEIDDYYRNAEIVPLDYTNSTFSSALATTLTDHSNFSEQIRYDYVGTYQGFGGPSQGHTITVSLISPTLSEVHFIANCTTNNTLNFSFTVDIDNLKFNENTVSTTSGFGKGVVSGNHHIVWNGDVNHHWSKQNGNIAPTILKKANIYARSTAISDEIQLTLLVKQPIFHYNLEGTWTEVGLNGPIVLTETSPNNYSIAFQGSTGTLTASNISENNVTVTHGSGAVGTYNHHFARITWEDGSHWNSQAVTASKTYTNVEVLTNNKFRLPSLDELRPMASLFSNFNESRTCTNVISRTHGVTSFKNNSAGVGRDILLLNLFQDQLTYYLHSEKLSNGQALSPLGNSSLLTAIQVDSSERVHWRSQTESDYAVFPGGKNVRSIDLSLRDCFGSTINLHGQHLTVGLLFSI